MKNRIIILLAMLTCILATSCVKEQLETVYNKQEEQIDKYINKAILTTDESGNPDTLRVVRNEGSNRIVIKEGIGDELAKNGYVSFYYAGYTFNGSVSSSNMFSTNRLESAVEVGWSAEESEYTLYEISLKDAELLPGLRSGLEGVKAGEECEILFSAKYGFGNKPLGMIPAKTALLYKIWVVGVTND